MALPRAQRVVIHTTLGNLLLVIIKLMVGIASGSAALVAEALHSAGDVLASIVVFVSLRLSCRPADERHHFGHGKIDPLCSCLVGLLLVYISYELCMESLYRLSAGQTAIPGAAALYVAGMCLVVKEGMYRYTIAVAEKTGSLALKADAWHHRTDMMILAAVFAGIAGARLGYPALDGLTALAVSVLIARLGIGICWRGLGSLLDEAPSDALIAKIKNITLDTPGVNRLNCLRARQNGSAIHLELHIGVDGKLPVEDAHKVGEVLQENIHAKLPETGHVLVHIDPVCFEAKKCLTP